MTNTQWKKISLFLFGKKNLQNVKERKDIHKSVNFVSQLNNLLLNGK